MAFTMDFEFMDGWILATVRGEITTQNDYEQKVREVVAKRLEAGMFRVLLDERDMYMDLDILEITQVMDRMASDGVQTQGGRIACVCNPECTPVYRHVETVSRNRSFSYSLFDNMYEATSWLLE